MTDKEVKKVACDPGWNDPPLFSYEHQTQLDQQQLTGKRPSLNKRVVFPSTPPTPGAVQNVTGQTPPKSTLNDKPPPASPLPPSMPPITPPNIEPEKGNEVPISDEKEVGSEDISLVDVLDNFKQAVAEVYGAEKEKQSSDVLRRVQTMETMWQDEKFDFKIKEKIFHLSEALKTGDLNKADSLQKSLMVDHSSLCSTWMSGIRHLLNSKRSLQK